MMGACGSSLYGLRRTLAAHRKANPTEPNLVSGLNTRETLDSSAVYKCPIR